MSFELMDHQRNAIENLSTGKILIGGTGSGKSITALVYAAQQHPDKRIVVLTTAKKRDSGEWFADAMKVSLRQDMVVDSWNNIKKYVNIEDAFFVLDEQRIVGNGAWVKTFFKIAKENDWIMLSATPADTWNDLAPVLIANGLYRNKTDFNDQHVRFSRFSKYPKIDGYLNTWKLVEHRTRLYVEMPFEMPTTRIEHMVDVGFDLDEQRKIWGDRWHIYEDRPLKDAGEMLRTLRKACNLHWSRIETLKDICKQHDKVIVYYNHNYELEQLRCLMPELDIPMAEWNGHNHQPIPVGDRWIYLVQYQAGSEGWNCIETDTIVFYSLPYSYRNFHQAKGRIDRLNTTFTELHYYIFKSRSIIDIMIWRALTRKKSFQAGGFAKKNWVADPEPKTRLN